MINLLIPQKVWLHCLQKKKKNLKKDTEISIQTENSEKIFSLVLDQKLSYRENNKALETAVKGMRSWQEACPARWARAFYSLILDAINTTLALHKCTSALGHKQNGILLYLTIVF